MRLIKEVPAIVSCTVNMHAFGIQVIQPIQYHKYVQNKLSLSGSLNALWSWFSQFRNLRKELMFLATSKVQSQYKAETNSLLLL